MADDSGGVETPEVARGGRCVGFRDSDSTHASTPMVVDPASDVIGMSAHSQFFVTAGDTSNPAIAQGSAPVEPPAVEMKRSFANVVSPSTNVNFKSLPRSSTSRTLSASEIQRQHATFIIRRAPPDMSPQKAIQTIAAQMGRPPAALFESVLRDPQDRRRMYLVFKSPALRDEVAARGFKLGNVTIKPTDGALSGYIPFPPYFVDTSSIVVELSRHGHVTHAQFVTTSEGIRVAGIQFKLKLRPNASPPREIQYGGFTMAIKYDDDIRECGFCHAFGHTIKYCHRRAATLAERNLRSSLRTERHEDTATTSPTAIQSDRPVTPCREALMKLDDIRRRWVVHTKELAKEEEQTLHELTYHTYVKTIAFHDVLEKAVSETPDLDTPLRLAGEEVTARITADWKAEWTDIRRTYFDRREESHKHFLSEGMPSDIPAHPDHLAVLPPVPMAPNFDSVRDKSVEDINGHAREFGLYHSLQDQLRESLFELLEQDMADMSSADDTDSECGSEVADEKVNTSTVVPVPPKKPATVNTPQYSTPTSPPPSPADTSSKSIKILPQELYEKYRALLPRKYSKHDCPYAIKIDGDTTLHRMKHLVWTTLYCASKHDTEINPVATLPVEYVPGKVFMLYLPTLSTANVLHEYLTKFKEQFSITKLTEVKTNKSYRQPATKSRQGPARPETPPEKT